MPSSPSPPPPLSETVGAAAAPEKMPGEGTVESYAGSPSLEIDEVVYPQQQQQQQPREKETRRERAGGTEKTRKTHRRRGEESATKKNTKTQGRERGRRRSRTYRRRLKVTEERTRLAKLRRSMKSMMKQPDAAFQFSLSAALIFLLFSLAVRSLLKTDADLDSELVLRPLLEDEDLLQPSPAASSLPPPPPAPPAPLAPPPVPKLALRVGLGEAEVNALHKELRNAVRQLRRTWHKCLSDSKEDFADAYLPSEFQEDPLAPFVGLVEEVEKERRPPLPVGFEDLVKQAEPETTEAAAIFHADNEYGGEDWSNCSKRNSGAESSTMSSGVYSSATRISVADSSKRSSGSGSSKRSSGTDSTSRASDPDSSTRNSGTYSNKGTSDPDSRTRTSDAYSSARVSDADSSARTSEADSSARRSEAYSSVRSLDNDSGIRSPGDYSSVRGSAADGIERSFAADLMPEHTKEPLNPNGKRQRIRTKKVEDDEDESETMAGSDSETDEAEETQEGDPAHPIQTGLEEASAIGESTAGGELLQHVQQELGQHAAPLSIKAAAALRAAEAMIEARKEYVGRLLLTLEVLKAAEVRVHTLARLRLSARSKSLPSPPFYYCGRPLPTPEGYRKKRKYSYVSFDFFLHNLPPHLVPENLEGKNGEPVVPRDVVTFLSDAVTIADAHLRNSRAVSRSFSGFLTAVEPKEAEAAAAAPPDVSERVKAATEATAAAVEMQQESPEMSLPLPQALGSLFPMYLFRKVVEEMQQRRDAASVDTKQIEEWGRNFHTAHICSELAGFLDKQRATARDLRKRKESIIQQWAKLQTDKPAPNHPFILALYLL
ncbi:hypothetical protein, conserved [Eimeria tenella]|uniref:Uncharacterized protein n=1 Tax=Eimeria tenella TaxID=5802 RepID=U6L2N7_EIMTE|nr:hypothetical protein, conserved [Eimeria tenella]CDJ42030.1 hypothetical protein, conserved [Eimeria tenella]|eukprot:XP_013232780.1 hypothetical protein, conserved [Eimeria tenella]